jgi:hypothetical protein
MTRVTFTRQFTRPDVEGIAAVADRTDGALESIGALAGATQARAAAAPILA